MSVRSIDRGETKMIVVNTAREMAGYILQIANNEQGNTYHQVKNMRDFYFNLFEEVAPNGKYFKRG